MIFPGVALVAQFATLTAFGGGFFWSPPPGPAEEEPAAPAPAAVDLDADPAAPSIPSGALANADPAGPEEVAAATASEPVQPPPQPITRLDERTAYTIGRHRLKLGILAFEYGITQHVSVGTDPPAWAVRTLADVWVPNLHVKYTFVDMPRVALAGNVGAYYAIAKTSTSGEILVLPLSLFGSVPITHRLTLHGEGAYVFARAIGSADIARFSVRGAAAARAVQAQLMGQYQLTRVMSLTALGRIQPYTGQIGFSGSSNPDPFTTASVQGQLVPQVEHPWAVIGGVAFLWKYVHLSAGVGYGYYFVPGLDIAYPKRTVIPDASLSVLL